MTQHARVSVSAICTFKLSLPEQLDFWHRHSIDNVGVSVAKLEEYGWDRGMALVRAARDAGLGVGNLIGLGPFALHDPSQWSTQQDRLVRSLDAAVELGARCMVFTTGPAGTLTWEAAADALDSALAPVLAEARARGVRFAVEHTNSLRVDVGFVHSLADVIDLARRLDTGVCMEINACWAERGLATTIADGIDRIALVQISDYRIGTLTTPARLVPGDGDIPIERIVQTVLDAGYTGDFDLELIGPAIDDEGYDVAVPRSIEWLSTLLERIA